MYIASAFALTSAIYTFKRKKGGYGSARNSRKCLFFLFPCISQVHEGESALHT